MMEQTPRHAQSGKAPELAPGMPAPLRPGDLAVVVGAGSSGRAAARLLIALGTRVRLVDKSFSIPEDARALARGTGVELCLGDHTPGQFEGAALVVTSPGVPLSVLAPLLERAGNPPLVAEMELALRFVREPILAVTGTSGKTTTVSLAAAMLREAGKKAFLGGNIGTPLSEYALGEDRADVLVLELSSFQLQGCAHLRPRVAALLNLTPNHLDHHRDMVEYADAKFSIFALQGPEDLALVPENLLPEYKRRGFAARVEMIAPTRRFPRGRLLGTHNAANAEAAYLACREFGVTEEQAVAAVAAFAPLRHRLEKAGTLDGVSYVNDSKSTTVESLRAALTSFDRPVLLLAGGRFKGGDLASLRDLIREKVKAVALFGASREIFEEAWRDAAPLTWDPELPQAVRRLKDQALPGDVILLSPATASYDLYENYGKRGDHFRDIARELGAVPDGGQA